MSRIKICGLSRQADIAAVNSVLPDYVGFVFAKSSRMVSLETAAALRDMLDSRITPVGVFVNEVVETVAALYKNGTINIAQLHGDEDAAYIAKLKELCDVPVIKAIGVGNELIILNEMMQSQIYGINYNTDYLLFDTLSPKRGGTGKPFAWELLEGYNATPYFLAGGISAANAIAAIRMLNPFCLDVSSGVETGGVKDARKIAEVVKIVKNVKQPANQPK